MFNLIDIFYLYRHLIDHELTLYLSRILILNYTYFIFFWKILIDFIQKNITALTQYEHSTLCKSDLSYFCSFGHIGNFYQIFSITIPHSFNFNRTQFRFLTHIKFSFWVNICFMIPSECHINNIKSEDFVYKTPINSDKKKNCYLHVSEFTKNMLKLCRLETNRN